MIFAVFTGFSFARISRLWRIASIAGMFAARAEGIHADKSTVTSATAAAILAASMETHMRMGIGKPSAENPSPIKSSVIPMPPIPERIPSGIPTVLTHRASKSTMPRSCLRVAPMDASSPNCRVRSDTDMENAL